MRLELVAGKHAQAVALMREHDLDCWLTFQREGSDPLLPFVMGGDYLVGTSGLMLFADGPSVAVVSDSDVSQVEGAFDQVVSYSTDWREPIVGVLSERKPARIGINISVVDHGVDGLTHGLYLMLREMLEPAGLADRLVSAEPVAGRVRACKIPEEVERMRRACAITQRIFDDLTGMLKPGLTEADVADIIRERMTTYEVVPSWEAGWCPSVASTKSAGGHSAPGATVIEAGDGVRVDFGIISEGYASDLQRTWYLLRPGEKAAPPEYVRAFDAVRDGIQLAADLLKPGSGRLGHRHTRAPDDRRPGLHLHPRPRPSSRPPRPRRRHAPRSEQPALRSPLGRSRRRGHGLHPGAMHRGHRAGGERRRHRQWLRVPDAAAAGCTWYRTSG